MTEQEPNRDEEAPQPQPTPGRLALPAPESQPSGTQGVFDRVIGWIELHPLAAATALFVTLTLLHLLALDLGGVAVTLAGSALIEILLLAFIAYNVVLPTLLARSCLVAFVDVAPALSCNDRVYDECLESLASPHAAVRLVFGLFWAAILTPVFGNLFQSAIPGDAASAALLTIWLYIRIALTFGLLGSSITYIAMLHYRFSAATSDHLRVDLFDLTQLQPLALHANRVALYLIVLLALVGPAVARPDATPASAALLLSGLVLALVAVLGSMWGARRAIRNAKQTALAELQTYAREIWRRAYTNGRIVEAVALPAMAAMLTVRSEISRMSDWPGGRAVFIRLAGLAAIPVATWFASELAAYAATKLL